MQKKIKSRLADLLVILVCLAGSALSVWQFWTELNKTLVKLNDEPIATITFKQNTAQRKFSDDFVWDRLRQNSPVYNGDTIRTAELSEATIYFNDGNIMDLSENTMARISLNSGGGAAVDFSGGQISVQAADSGLTITSGSSVVDVTKGASVTASSVPSTSSAGGSKEQPEEVFRVQVQSGTAAVSTGTQAVSLSAGKTADLTGDGKVEKRNLSVISPAPEVKMLNFDSEEMPVAFQWDSEGADVKIEFSDTKNFAAIRESFEYSGIDQATMMLPAGTHYWRIVTGEEMLSGKVIIYASKAPSAIAPVSDYTAHYRSVMPSIRFIWSESERATTYAFEVADNPEMRNPVISQRVQQTSSIVTTLGEGKYYWRVTPYFTINNLGFSHPSEVNSFAIEKSGALVAPELLMPKAGSVVSTKVSGESGDEAQNVLFSWKDNIEASSYTVTITPDSPSYGSEIKATVTSNYFSLDTATNHVGNGSWKWSIEMTDVEGNSVKSESVPFLAMDSEISQKALFPANDYYLSVSRVYDTNFVWKSNLSSEMEIQFATDPSFNNITSSFTSKNTSESGLNLAVGDYYWRVVTKTDAGTFVSDASHFYVEDTLPAPVCVIPDNGSRFVVGDDRVIGFTWKPVETADYYQFRVYGSDDPNDIIYENMYIEEDGRDEYSERVSFMNMPEKTYYWSVQAYREESDTMFRAVSLLGKYSFFLRILKPITLTSPSNGAVLEGLDVVMYPPEMDWNSIDELSSSELYIYKDSVNEENVVAVIPDPEMDVTMPRLYEGTYFWTVRGITWDDLDASSKQVKNFRITKIPPMDPPVQVTPKKTDEFSTAYFDKTLDIKFSWEPVQYATKYIFTLKDTDGKELRSAEIPSPDTSYTVNFANFIHEGTYSWTIEARTVFDDGVVRYGKTNTSEFTISLPLMAAPIKNPVSKENVLDENLYYRDKNIHFSWSPVQYADEYIFTLKNSRGEVITEQSLRNRNAVPATKLAEPETYYDFKDVESLEPGNYIWLVEARNYINGKLMQNGRNLGNSFAIRVNNMKPPVKEYPADGKVFESELFAADEGLKFTWQPVEFATEYIFTLSDGEGNQLAKEALKTPSYTYMDLESLKEGKYTWTVEANSYLRGKLLQTGNVEGSSFEIRFPDLAAPRKVTPVENYVVDAAFIINEKDLVFSWNKIPYADEYILTVTDPEGTVIRDVSITDVKTETSLSYSIPAADLLKQGEYKWSVEALFHYHGELLQHGVKEESIFSVVITDLEPPVVIAPAEATVFSTAYFRNDEPQVFSWNAVSLASEYVFTLYAPDGTAVEQQTVAETSVSVDKAKFVANGEYTWTVEAKSYYHGELLQNGINASTKFVTNVPRLNTPVPVSPEADVKYDSAYFKSEITQTFTWTGVPFADDYVFRLEKSSGDIVVEAVVLPSETLSYTVETEKFSYEDNYYWTVEPRTYFRESVLQTGEKARRPFAVIMPPLSIPADKQPADNTVYGIKLFKTTDAIDFTWRAVNMADCYYFTVKNSAGAFIEETIIPAESADADGMMSYRMDASNFIKEDVYTWSVEARVMYNGRIIQKSLLSEYTFKVELPSPAAPVNTSTGSFLIDYDYIRVFDDVILKWSPVEFADEYKVRVYNLDESLQKEFTVKASNSPSLSIPLSMFLAPGAYKLEGEAIISYMGKPFLYSEEAEGYLLTVFPELGKPVVVSPADEVVLDTSYFKKNREILFSWNPVKYSSGYRFTLYGPDDEVIVSKTLPNQTSTSYVFDDLTKLSPGVFRWKLETYFSKGNNVLVEGVPAENEFTIDLPTLKAPSLGNTGRLYGN